MALAAAEPYGLAHLLAHESREILARYIAQRAVSPWEDAWQLARSELSAALAELGQEVDRRLLEAFRAYVGVTVVAVSPLLLDASATEGIELDCLASQMRHDAEWRQWLGGPPPKMVRWPAGFARPVRAELGVAASLRRLRYGHVFRELWHPRGAFGMRVGGRCLEVAMRTDAYWLRSSSGRGVLTITGPVPETLRIAMTGRLLDDVLDHPVTRGRGYRIREARGGDGGEVTLVFAARPVAWRLPWAREVAESAGPPPAARPSCGG
ncbi:hypothetical protein [Sphingomonas sp. UYAg733]